MDLSLTPAAPRAPQTPPDAPPGGLTGPGGIVTPAGGNGPASPPSPPLPAGDTRALQGGNPNHGGPHRRLLLTPPNLPTVQPPPGAHDLGAPPANFNPNTPLIPRPATPVTPSGPAPQGFPRTGSQQLEATAIPRYKNHHNPARPRRQPGVIARISEASPVKNSLRFFLRHGSQPL